jgi:hypothetical protein
MSQGLVRGAIELRFHTDWHMYAIGEKKDTHTKNQNDGSSMGCVRGNNWMTFKEQ